MCQEVINDFHPDFAGPESVLIPVPPRYYSINFKYYWQESNQYLAVRCVRRADTQELYVFYAYRTKTVFSAIRDYTKNLTLKYGIYLDPKVDNPKWSNYYPKMRTWSGTFTHKYVPN